MSSFLGHAAAGAAIFLCRSRLDAPHARWALLLCVLLALAPDADYLLIWFFQFPARPRLTHTLLFCLGVSALAGLVTRISGRTQSATTFITLALASLSHLPLDLLVGGHALPVFWPFSSQPLRLPIGILPGAVHAPLTSYYLWRNLLIECGILLPMLALLVASCRAVPLKYLLSLALKLLPLWLACLICTLNLT